MDLETVCRGIVVALFCALVGLRLRFRWRAGRLVEIPLVRREGIGVVLVRLVLGVPLLALTLLYSVGLPASAMFAIALPVWLRLAGLPVALLALVLLWKAHAALGTCFSSTLRLREDHHLVQHGPYSWVQHPIYVAYLLFFAGVLLLSANAGIGGLGIAVILSLLTLRLPREEALLRERFGARWERYARATGRFVPRIARIAALFGRPARDAE